MLFYPTKFSWQQYLVTGTTTSTSTSVTSTRTYNRYRYLSTVQLQVQVPSTTSLQTDGQRQTKVGLYKRCLM